MTSFVLRSIPYKKKETTTLTLQIQGGFKKGAVEKTC